MVNPSSGGQHVRRRRLLLAPLAVLALAAVGLTLYLSNDRDEEGLEAPAEAPAQGEIDLALRFAPIYQLRLQEQECDHRGEPFVPSPVELVLGQPGVRLRQPQGPTLEGPLAADLTRASGAAFLDYPGDPRRPGCRYERDARRFGEGLPPTVYARVVGEPDKPGLVIQYWSFYYFNDWNNKHEGDWEMVQVVFDAASVDEAMLNGPEYVVYAQHGGGERASWDAKKLRKVGDRPVVYVSAGSHASYFAPNTYLGLGEGGTGLGCDVALPPHRPLDARVALLDEGAPGSPPVDAWFGFPGRWGQVVSGEFSGPTGPQTKRAWREPLTWAEDARDGSATLPGGDVLGVDAVHSFCDVVEAGSLLLRTYMRFPLLVGGAGFVLVGAVSVGGLVVLRDVTRSPLVDRTTAGFLRRRRSLGQIIRAAVIIYWRFPGLFLGIAFTFIPVSFVLALLQDWLLTIPPFDRIHWLLSANEVSHLLLGLLVGGMASFAVYLFVVSGAIATVGLLDKGQQPDIRTVYSSAMRGAPAVVLARLRTLVALALLGISIIGLPVAAWLAVRWFFVEEAVLLDGESHWRAPGASSRVVDGQWFRSLGRVLCFGVFGAFAGPLFAFALLLGTDSDPVLVNITAGLVHVAALPFTAIGLSLAYCDLQARAAERPARTSRPQRGLPRSADAVRAWATSVLHLGEGRRRDR